MAGSRVIPEVYFPDVDEQEQHTSDVEGEGGPGGGSAEEKTEDLTKEGFIPIYKLTLDDLPKNIRTEENLQHILDMATTVVVVNNNRLSDKRRDDEQMKKSGRSLKGSGRLIYWDEVSNEVLILTNRHVLFNNEELERSMFDVFYDYSHGNPEDKEKLFKRCRRGDGTFCFRMFSGLDVTQAGYDVKDEMRSHIRKHCRQNPEKAEIYHETQLPIPNHGASIVPTVCLISHPLGRTKHVSFGHLADVDYNTRTFHHTAPSKPGSSGAPIVIFSSKDNVIAPLRYPYHVGTDVATKHKEAKFMALFQGLFDTETSLMNMMKTLSDESDVRPDQLAASASVWLDTEYLAAFVPIFGAFLLHTEKYGLEGIDTALFKPCKTWVGAASAFSVVMKPQVRNFLQKVKQLLPGFDMGPSSSPGEEPDLGSLLTPQEPCFCRSIVKLMERGVKSGDSTVTETFLSPDTAAAKMSSDSDVTWPWLNRRECDVTSVCAEEEECLIKKCLQNYKCHQAEHTPIILLLMLRKANVSIAQIPPHSCEISFTTKSDEIETPPDIVNSQTAEALPREMTSEKRCGGTGTFPRSGVEEESKSSLTSSRGDCAEFIGNILRLVDFVSALFVETMSGGFNNTNGELSKQEQGDRSLNTLFSRYLAHREHEVQHLQQDHPDWKPLEKGDGSGGPCQCGRPSSMEVVHSLVAQHEHPLQDKCDTSLQLERASEISAASWTFFLLLQKEALEKQPDNPGNFTLNFLDKCGHFPKGRYSLILLVASKEAFLYNCRQLLRQVNKTVQTVYFALPASVYGRPGGWPGNVTPPEVQRKAWRLIQDAIMESGFPPAVLADLEEDAERRQRLIDLYVDMKQLKWQGRIQPHLFWAYLAVPKRIDISLSLLIRFPSLTLQATLPGQSVPSSVPKSLSVEVLSLLLQTYLHVHLCLYKHLTGAEHPTEKYASSSKREVKPRQ